MALPARLKDDHFKPKARQKVCHVCGEVFNMPANYSWAQWEAKTFCSNRCAQIIPLSERLYSAMEKDAVTGCWNWTGTKARGGYGRIVIREEGRRVQLVASRAAYEQWVGPIPVGMMVLHGCDNAGCINPQHLRLGTHQDNMDDKVARNRCRNQYGRPKKYASAAA
jgi:hypothetical protein